ncbi:MAG TPA: PilT/PilU family type 4a pilus ATPase [Terriglobales bacterium]|nr:PilT/PilU family type 4a pilus ATPase [Terriglobales bacterium]
MAAPANAPTSSFFEPSTSFDSGATQALLGAMLRAHEHVSDLIFSPGRPPQVEVHGHLVPVQAPGFRTLSADDTRRIAADLIGNNKQAINILREQGSCDVSYGLPGLARFRVNAFIQRGSCAIVMRVIPTAIPELATLSLPPQLAEIASLRDGMVLVTGPRGSGKSSTLAALLNLINQQQVCHIITIEDPIEFLHNHKSATVHQRELHSDTPSMPLALRAALRQAPNVILVSELRDRETVETVLEAAETGHLVLSSMNTLDAAKTVDRLLSLFPAGEQSATRCRLARCIRQIVSQKLIPRRDDRGRVPVVELLKVLPGTLESLEISNPATTHALHFDCEIEKLVRAGVVDPETAILHAYDPDQLRQTLADH